MGLLVLLDAFERRQLRLGQHEAFLRHFGLERLQALAHRFEIVTRPDHPHACLGDRAALFESLVRGAALAPRRLVDRQRDDRGFEVRGDPVVQIGLAPADLAQTLFTTPLVERLEAIKPVAALPHDLARLRHVPQLLRELENPQLWS